MEQPTTEQLLEALQQRHRDLLNMVWKMHKHQKMFFQFKSKTEQHLAMQQERKIDLYLDQALAEKKQPKVDQQRLF